MTPRLENHFEAAPEVIKAMRGVEAALAHCGLEKSLLHLVKVRASQINGCAYCIHLHAAHARAQGETEDRLLLLSAWRDSPLYTERERAALAWTESLTLVAQTGVPDADYELLRAQFTDAEQVNLTMAVGAINVWNRLQVGFRAVHSA